MFQHKHSSSFAAATFFPTNASATNLVLENRRDTVCMSETWISACPWICVRKLWECLNFLERGTRCLFDKLFGDHIL